MDAAFLTRYIKNRSEYGYYFYNTLAPQSQSKPITDLREGVQTFYFAKRLTLNPCACPPPPCLPDPIEPNCSVIDSAATGLQTLFKWLATTGKSPTATARFLYLYFFTVAAAFNWLVGSGTVKGIKDGWDWDETNAIQPTPRELYVWINHAIADLMPQFFSGADFTSVLAMEFTLFNWTPEEQTRAVNEIRSKGNWTLFTARWNTWFNSRLADGAATLPNPTTTEIVNNNLEIDVWSSVLPSFVDASKWTPLRVSPSPQTKQSYLTFFWDRVSSTGITSSQETTLDGITDPYFPPSPTARTAELQEVIDITAALSDTQKVTAEFWAGGPHTITPPGMMAWFWRDFVLTQRPGPTAAIFSGLDLGIHLFEGSRVTWRQKARKVQSRPIQDIRIGWSGQQLIRWDGQTIDGALWTPYQTSNFVTPPFADFPSGHSHFSQAFALTMTTWFGASLPTATITRGNMNLVSPVYDGEPSQTGAFHTILFPKGASEIQTGQVPSQPITLSWTTWQDLADSAGISRLYGGIHCMSAHTSSQRLAIELDTMIENIWNFQHH